MKATIQQQADAPIMSRMGFKILSVSSSPSIKGELTMHQLAMDGNIILVWMEQWHYCVEIKCTCQNAPDSK
jgi:hypothetical protein